MRDCLLLNRSNSDPQFRCSIQPIHLDSYRPLSTFSSGYGSTRRSFCRSVSKSLLSYPLFLGVAARRRLLLRQRLVCGAGVNGTGVWTSGEGATLRPTSRGPRMRGPAGSRSAPRANVGGRVVGRVGGVGARSPCPIGGSRVRVAIRASLDGATKTRGPRRAQRPAPRTGGRMRTAARASTGRRAPNRVL